MSKRRLLVAFAHPDDESFGMGGVISRYVDEGAEVYLICTTNGDVGTVSEEMLNGYDSIADLRLAELQCASEKLGFKQVFTFGYKDSGMMGSETSQDPACSWYEWQHNPDRLVRRVVEIMREVRPHVVVTFNKYGGYGHPDHIAVQRATVQAFDLAGDPNYVTEGLAPYQSQKLYYTSLPTFLLKVGLWYYRLRGKDPRKLGRNDDIDLLEILNNVEPVHTQIAIGDYLEAWQEANACHASQGGGNGGLIPTWLRRILSPKQGFTRIYPKPPVDRVDEDDLFAGVTLDESVVKETSV